MFVEDVSHEESRSNKNQHINRYFPGLLPEKFVLEGAILAVSARLPLLLSLLMPLRPLLFCLFLNHHLRFLLSYFLQGFYFLGRGAGFGHGGGNPPLMPAFLSINILTAEVPYFHSGTARLPHRKTRTDIKYFPGQSPYHFEIDL